ncbi:M10 family metallopeptidase C-terminal domain-containing protein [Roseibacterium sp. SDUM158016]|uniref:peroxidase family protein n=1 Tax=Roseicyclus sediminis TaxID=2980997 RepID=UPI0021D03E48|nr:peroxidase family protein [Roseibacterium sp. SDUM158016]MCU4651202.1 M10 family metallopeptidase C-terminal domain-containing protein [Roseibacterium sp. SDUM158016]
MNNLTEGRDTWGSADQVMPRLLDSTYLTQPEAAHLADPNPRAPLAGPTSYSQTAGSVYDAEPRIISNLIADQTLGNPAAVAAALAHSGLTGQAMLATANAIVQAHQRSLDLQATAGNVDGALALQRQQLQAAVETAQAAFNEAQSAAEGLVAEKGAADQAVADARTALDDAAATLLTLQNEGQVGAAQAALDDAQAVLSQAQGELDAAMAQLGAAQAEAATALSLRDAKLAEVTDLQGQKETADQALAEAQAAREQAQAALALEADSSAEVAAAQSAVTEAETSAGNAQAIVDDLVARLDIAQAALDDLNTQLLGAEGAVATAEDRVSVAQTRAAETQAARDAAQATFDTEVTELSAAQTAFLSALTTYLNGGSLAAFSAASTAYSQAREERSVAESALNLAISEDTAADIALADQQAALADARTLFETLTGQRDAALASRDDLSAQLSDANAILATAEATLLSARAELQTAEQNNQAFVAAQQAVVEAQALADAAQGTVDILAASLAAADAELATLESALVTADGDVTTLQAAADTAAETVTTAEADVATARQDLAAAQVADMRILDQLDLIADITLTLNAAIETAGQAETDLATAEVSAAQRQADLDTATADLAALDAPGAAEAAIAAAQTAAAEAQTALDALLATHGIELDGDNLHLPDVAPDEGLSAPYNSWMTLFGQFFDHGLDLVGKGGSGTVFIPLQPDDPLYDANSPTNFMVLTRATNQPGPDGILGTADDIREHSNKTTPWVDQNQTYTSHPSHQVFLREYDFDAGGQPVSNGYLLHGQTGGMSTWGDVKAQAAEKLGIRLNDSDVLDGPLLATDPYGNFIPGPNGLPQLVVPNPTFVEGGTEPMHILVEGNLADPVDASQAVRNGHAFLEDIAHTAAPGTFTDRITNETFDKTPDADTETGNAIQPNQFGQNETYDNELLDRHFIAGDGRGNENFGLTAVHHVFHSEHNRQVAEMKQTILDSGELAFVNEWLATPITDAELATATPDLLDWDGGRLFQAAKFTTEMQYQHLAFEEFGRRVQPSIAAFTVNSSSEINGAVFAEFAHVVYRFGHSMLTENVHTMDPNGVNTQNGLIEAFLNPVAFDNDQTLTSDQAAGAVARGMSRETGANIDEFLTSALRDNLVGLPLDLAALNIARGRDAGVPSLNAAREQFYSATGSEFLKPYDDWAEYAANLKNPASIINFIAAYGTHETIVNAQTVVEKRAAATDLVLGGPNAPADRLDFVNGTGAWAGTETGINDVEFWIGGLAEEIMPFGGMLGSTFGFVFQHQMENLQNGDRFYYLGRTNGMNMLGELENNSFASMIVRNTDIADGGAHIPADIFSSMEYILEVDQAVQSMPDPVSTDVDPFLAAMGQTLVERATATADAPLVDGTREYDNFLKFNGGEHVVLGGTDQRDILVGGLGDDALWGGAGDDLLIGDSGVNTFRGGDGNDIIKDGDDISFLHGEDGDDVISAGGGAAELIFGGKGNDAILMGRDDAKHAFAGMGNDFVLGGAGADIVDGGEGDDWIEGGDGFDVLVGDNNDNLGGSRVIGHDVLIGGPNDNDLHGESGDDILFQGLGTHVNLGELGFDWVAHKGVSTHAEVDLTKRVFTEQQQFFRDRYIDVEAVSGTDHDDLIWGDNRLGNEAPANGAILDNTATLFGNELTQEGVDRIEGLRELLGNLMGVEPGDLFTGGNILLGGAGSDTIQGRGGNDVIDGDKWLDARISIRDPNDPTVELRSIDSLAEIIPQLLDGSISPSQLQITRQIVDRGQEGDVDVAVYYDLRENYTIRQNPDGSVTVSHINVTAGPNPIDPVNGDPNPILGDGTDRLMGIEILRFADQEVDLRVEPIDNGVIQGTPGDDVIVGSNGPDAIFGDAGDDQIDGGPGTDVIFGEAGNDTIVWNAPDGGYDIVDGGTNRDGVTDIDVVQVNGDGTEEAITMYTVAAWLETGGAPPQDPNSEIVITRTVEGVETAIMEIRNIEEVVFNNVQGVGTISAVGDFATTSIGPATIYVNGTAGEEIIDFSGFLSTQRIVVDAGAGDDQITGGAGADLLLGGDGADLLTWSVGGGSDVADGGAGEDTYIVNGDASNEVFRVYAANAWTGAPLDAGVDIVITRDAGDGEQVIGQLRNIEEIRINTAGGADDVQVIGDFNPTALNFNTITIDDVDGDDNVNIEGLTSIHRILFRTEGNNNTVVGAVRDTDVIVLPEGFDMVAMTRSADPATGMVTITDGTNSVSFTPARPDVEPGIVRAGTPQAAAFERQTIDPVTGEASVPQGALVLDSLDVRALEYMVGATDVAPVLPLEAGATREEGQPGIMRGVRDLPGLENNEVNPGQGAATQPFIRITDARYGAPNDEGNRDVNPIFDGIDPRNVSNDLGAQEAGTAKAASANMFLMSFGQYFDHGLTFIPKDAANGVIPIGGPDTGRPGGDNPADLTRAKVIGFDENGVPQHENITSPFVDQNQVYGSSAQIGRLLREPGEEGGLGAGIFGGALDPSRPEGTDFRLLPTLREALDAHIEAGTLFEAPDGRMVTLQEYYPGLRAEDGSYDGGLVADLVGDFMGEGWPLLIDTNRFIDLLDHAIGGDGRVNENIGLTSMHTIFARNHNFYVEQLKLSGFQGTDEELFQAAKILNEAEYQQVVFNDFADALIGGLKGSGRHGHDEYFPDTDASISHEFAGAVYRLGHSMIGETLTVMGPDGQPMDVPLFDAFLNPSNEPGIFRFDHDRDPTTPELTGQDAVDALGMGPMGYTPQPGYAQYGAGAVLEGMALQPSEEVDFNIVDTVRDNLVRVSADLFSFNVARGWDLGLGTLNQVKMDLRDSTDRYVREAIELSDMAMEPYTSWEDFQARNNLSDMVIEQFKSAYPDLILGADEVASFREINPKLDLAENADGSFTVKGIDRVDLWVGGLAESHINDGIVGHTFWVVIHEQLDRLQEGDRFYYTDRLGEMPVYANFISNSTMADIVARNTGIEGLGVNVFSYEPQFPDTVTESPIVEPPVNDAPMSETPADDAPVSETPVDDAPVSETPVDDASVSEPPVDDAPVSEPPADDAPVSETPVDDTPVSEPPADDAPVSETPVDDASMSEPPVDDAPVSEPPVDDASVSEPPVDDTPVSETPVDDAPVSEPPVDDAPVSEPPADDAPVSEEPTPPEPEQIAPIVGFGTIGDDELAGGVGDDVLLGNGGNDILRGGDGADVLNGNAGTDVVFGDGGADVIDGGDGEDVLFGGAGDDLFFLSDDGSIDIVFGGEGQDRVDLSGTTADLRIDLGSLSDVGSIQSGTTLDRLFSIEDIVSGDGNDVITAGNSANVIATGEGSDTVRFLSAGAADGDHIADFAPGDRIDLSSIDAVRGAAGDQAFTLVTEGEGAAGAGSLVMSTDEDGNTVLTGHLDDDGQSDFSLSVRSSHTLSQDDFNF